MSSWLWLNRARLVSVEVSGVDIVVVDDGRHWRLLGNYFVVFYLLKVLIIYFIVFHLIKIMRWEHLENIFHRRLESWQAAKGLVLGFAPKEA